MSNSQHTLNGRLQERMKREWDERIQRDYRFWMSDGVDDDQAMWSAGERDFALLAQYLPPDFGADSIALEIGCGVGRLLKPASKVFQQVLGVDISAEAVAKAEVLLQSCENVEVYVGNGFLLSEIPDSSIDFIFSFAALGNMPICAVVQYLQEMSRIARVGGRVSLQLYVGENQRTAEEDTLAVRAFNKSGVLRVFHDLGFLVRKEEELILPLEVSDQARGVVAELFHLERLDVTPRYFSNYELLLVDGGERSAGADFRGSESAYAMALARAEQLEKQGRSDEAADWIKYAQQIYSAPPRLAPSVALPLLEPARDFFSTNFAVLERRFPEAAHAVANASDGKFQAGKATNGEPIIFVDGAPFDNIEKPTRGGEVWAERSLKQLASSRDITLLGFGAGYSIESLAKITDATLRLIEPSAALFRLALKLRDFSALFERLESISVGEDLPKRFGAESDLLIHPQAQILFRAEVSRIKESFWAVRGTKELRPSLAVVGPLYGGTLPISRYVASALERMKQRVQLYDFSRHHSAFMEVNRYLKDRHRTDYIQSRYVEMLSELLLEAATERPIDILICLAQAPVSPHVLTELRKRGTITVMWFVEDCRRFPGWKHLSPYFDYMFLIQKGDILQQVQEAGCGKAIYLPVAAQPDVHCPVVLSAAERQEWGSQLSFVGAGYHNRQQMFASLADRDFKIWGTEWPTCAPFDKLVQANGRRIAPEEYNKIFSGTDININLHSSMERDGVEPNGDFVNPRTFELAAAGAFQLADNRELLPELFAVGDEIATFSDKRELLQKIEYYSAHPDERRKITAKARERVLRDHTYEKRLQQMLGYIYADRYAELQQKRQVGPWPRTITAAEPFPELKQRLETVRERGAEPKLENLVNDITTGKGTLTDTEQRLLFLHHIRSQITYIEEKRSGKG